MKMPIAGAVGVGLFLSVVQLWPGDPQMGTWMAACAMFVGGWAALKLIERVY
jgi:hypothetical protein